MIPSFRSVALNLGSWRGQANTKAKANTSRGLREYSCTQSHTGAWGLGEERSFLPGWREGQCQSTSPALTAALPLLPGLGPDQNILTAPESHSPCGLHVPVCERRPTDRYHGVLLFQRGKWNSGLHMCSALPRSHTPSPVEIWICSKTRTNLWGGSVGRTEADGMVDVYQDTGLVTGRAVSDQNQ